MSKYLFIDNQILTNYSYIELTLISNLFQILSHFN